ncbi:hypothetical protein [Marinobacterium aestuariivivens]|uniref:Uncharacterized protein n=1 Tax=Marinobacterium aestuariivivens TaxID=1698799 RepID=A0ABW2A572_9GAMM
MSGVEKLIRSAGRAYRTFLKLDQDPARELEEGKFWLNLQQQQGFYADIETDSGLTVSEIAEIVFGLEQAAYDHDALKRSETEADTCWERIRGAREIMRMSDPSIRHDIRMRRALFHLGLIGDDNNKGGSMKNHRLMASHYFALRAGDNWLENGELKQLKPHSHAEAEQIIFNTYEIDWRTLKQACKRKGIPLSKDSENFPKA